MPPPVCACAIFCIDNEVVWFKNCYRKRVQCVVHTEYHCLQADDYCNLSVLLIIA